MLYQAHLRHELTRRLGVAWQPVANGHADIDGADRELIETFSQRRNAIVEHREQRGEASAAAAQTATLATRQTKGERDSETELRGVWGRRARQVGVRPGWHRRLLGRTATVTPDLDGLVDELIDQGAITATNSSFTRRDALQAVAERLPTGLLCGRVRRRRSARLDGAARWCVEGGFGHLEPRVVTQLIDERWLAGDEGPLEIDLGRHEPCAVRRPPQP